MSDESKNPLRLIGKLEGLQSQLGESSGQKPDDSITEFQFGIVNEILHMGNEMLGEKYRPISGFDGFSKDENLPKVRDVQLIISQYLAEAKRFSIDCAKDKLYKPLHRS